MGGLPSRRWSVIIPAYNEAARLPSYLKEVQAYFEGRDESYEVIVVDDGSQDGTADRVREVAAGRSAVTGFRVVEVPVNWADQPGSKVGVLREGPRMIYEVLTARRRLARRGTGDRSA